MSRTIMQSESRGRLRRAAAAARRLGIARVDHESAPARPLGRVSDRRRDSREAPPLATAGRRLDRDRVVAELLAAHFARNRRSFSRMTAAKSTPLPSEGPAAEVMHERVAGDHGPIAGLDRPQAVVVVLEAADAEPLVEQPDRVDHLAPDQQAEPDQPADLHAHAVVGLAPIPGEPVQVGQALVAEPRPAAAR